MPSNPYRDELKMRKAVDFFIMRQLSELGEITYNQFMLGILLKHAVSETQITKFVNKFYVDMGIIKIKDGVMIK